jgi:hypothetical protein
MEPSGTKYKVAMDLAVSYAAFLCEIYLAAKS